MSADPQAQIRPVLPFTRLVFIISIVLAAIAGVQLYILTDRTDRYFAWTIGNPLSATFLGGGFWTGTLLLLFALREDAWANIRVALAAVVTFVPVLLLSTLLHLDVFHFHSSRLGAQVAAWAWLIVYIVVPFFIVALLILQLRAAGGDPAAGGPLPRWLAALLGVSAAAALAVGLLLVLIPTQLFSVWPWQLTKLTAQVVGAGFLSIAVATFWFMRENSWVRGRVGVVPYTAVGLLQLIALARYEGKVDWGRPGAWLYLLYLLGMLVGGIYSTLMVWQLDLGEDDQPAPVPQEA
jgi:hypothetical protein